MDANPILHINMLGGCSLSYGDSSIDDAGYRAKKPWTLLAYLIVFRTREIPLEELTEGAAIALLSAAGLGFSMLILLPFGLWWKRAGKWLFFIK